MSISLAAYKKQPVPANCSTQPLSFLAPLKLTEKSFRGCKATQRGVVRRKLKTRDKNTIIHLCCDWDLSCRGSRGFQRIDSTTETRSEAIDSWDSCIILHRLLDHVRCGSCLRALPRVVVVVLPQQCPYRHLVTLTTKRRKRASSLCR